MHSEISDLREKSSLAVDKGGQEPQTTPEQAVVLSFLKETPMIPNTPGQGGYTGSLIESEGAPGDKGEGGMSTPTGDTTDGDYNHGKISKHGNYPHSPADPPCGGPPLGAYVGPNGDTA